MPKAGVHPMMRKVLVITARGASIEIPTVLKSITGQLRLTTDPDVHHVWTGKKKEQPMTGMVAKFRQRFQLGGRRVARDEGATGNDTPGEPSSAASLRRSPGDENTG